MSNPVSLRNEMVSFKEDGKPQAVEGLFGTRGWG